MREAPGTRSAAEAKSCSRSASEDGSGDTVEFRGGFTTIALPGRSVETGKDGRLDCEVTVLEARGIQQFGFACEGFTANRGNGVGDDDKRSKHTHTHTHTHIHFVIV